MNVPGCLITPPASSHISYSQMKSLPLARCGVSHVLLFSSFFFILLFLFLTSPPPQRQRLIRARVGPEEAGASGEEGLGANGAWGRENGTVAEGDTQPLDGERESGKEMGVDTGGGAQPKEEEEEEEEQEEGEEEDAPFKPFVLPGEK